MVSYVCSQINEFLYIKGCDRRYLVDKVAENKSIAKKKEITEVVHFELSVHNVFDPIILIREHVALKRKTNKQIDKLNADMQEINLSK